MNLIDVLRYWIIAKWAQWTQYDLKGDLQMQERAAWQEVKDVWYSFKENQ